MDQNQVKHFRIAGIASITAAILLLISDLLLTYTGEITSNGLLDLYVLDFAKWRLYAGAWLGVFAVPFYLAGYWLIYQLLKPAGNKYIFPLLLLAFYSIAFGFAQVHSFFGIRGIILQTGSAISEDFISQYYKPIVDNLTNFEMPFIIITYFLGMFIPSLWVMAIILIKKTYYKKWMAFLNVATIFLLFYLTRFVSPALYSLLMDIAVNFGHFVFFLIPTILLWNGLPKMNLSRKTDKR